LNDISPAANGIIINEVDSKAEDDEDFNNRIIRNEEISMRFESQASESYAGS